LKLRLKELKESNLQEIRSLKKTLKTLSKELRLYTQSAAAPAPTECKHEPVANWVSNVGPAPCRKCGLVIF
jgi:hypothetical protein